MQINNFGKNICFEPEHFYAPQTESEVLELLAKHRGKKIRVVGRLHSWSEVTVGDEVVLDLRKMNEVRVEEREGVPWAIIAGGAQIKHIIAELENKFGLALPSLGLITEQTIAGVAATGTHGSGKHSFSHYVDEMRVANYDPLNGEPTIRCISDGEELRAARCSLGCLGVVLSVAIRVRPQYRLEQHFRLTQQLTQVFDGENEFPLQQFYLNPFRWDYLIQHRKETSKSPTWLTWLHRAYWYLIVDVALHILLIALRRWLRSRLLIHMFYKYAVVFALIRNWKVTDKSQNLLTMEHELFRHIEVEIFVLRQQLPAALDYVTQLLRFLDDKSKSMETSMWEQLATYGLDEEVRNCIPYTHHYPICIRKVLADDTLISMASSPQEAYYAISFISYDRPSERTSFFAFANLLVKTTSLLFEARPHWGKYCPLDAAAAERLYPKLGEFRAICEQIDNTQAFRNKWADKVLWNCKRV